MRAAISAEPARLFQLGNRLLSAGRPQVAVEAFRRCLAAAPEHAGTHYNLGNALLASGRAAEAVEAYLACLRHARKFGAAYLNLAETLRRLGMLDQARWAAEVGLRLLPEPAAAPCLANVLHDLGLYEPAAALYRQALHHDPRHAGWLSSLGNTLLALGRTAEALAAHERAVAATPADADIRFNRAVALLTAGDLARGWTEYEWRWMRPSHQGRQLGPWWTGRCGARPRHSVALRAGAGRHAAFRSLCPAGRRSRLSDRAGGAAGTGPAVPRPARCDRSRVHQSDRGRDAAPIGRAVSADESAASVWHDARDDPGGNAVSSSPAWADQPMGRALAEHRRVARRSVLGRVPSRR